MNTDNQQIWTYYSLTLHSSGYNKADIIREIQNIKNCDLETCKRIINTPNSFITYTSNEHDANILKQKFEYYGALVSISKIESPIQYTEVYIPGQNHNNVKEPADFTTTAIFALLLGWFGVHRFYTGYIGIGVLQLLTFGGVGIWSLIDLICICLNKYKDYDGNELKKYNKKTGTIILTISLIFTGLFILSGLDEDSASGTNQPTQTQTQVVTNETCNGIAFKITSKYVARDSQLRILENPAVGDPLVMVVEVQVKNNGKEPFMPDVEAWLSDKEGAVYAAEKVRNFVEILNSSQENLNPGMSRVDTFYFRIPEVKNFIINLRDGSFISDTVSIQL